MNTACVLRAVRHYVFRWSSGFLWILTLVGCGRPDVPTSAPEPTAVDVVAEPTTIDTVGAAPHMDQVKEMTRGSTSGTMVIPNAIVKEGASHDKHTTGSPSHADRFA